jgi:hypothetical protein
MTVKPSLATLARKSPRSDESSFGIVTFSRYVPEPSTAAWAERYRRSSIRSRYVDDRAGRTSVRTTVQPQAQARRPPSALRQSVMLSRRGFLLKARDAWNGAILFAQAPIIALLLVVVFGGASRASAAGSEPRAATPRQQFSSS